MGAIAAAVLMKERHIVEAFQSAGATSSDRSRTPDEINVDTFGIAWRRLRDHAVVRETAPGSGHYYVDVEVWQAVRRTRQRIVLVAGLIALLFALLATMGPWRR